MLMVIDAVTVAGAIAAAGTARFAAVIAANATTPAAHAAVFERGRLNATAHEIAAAIAIANTCIATCWHVATGCIIPTAAH